jgi:hypothetical protein
MIEFDRGQHLAVIHLSLAGVSMPVSLDLRDIRSEPLLRDSRLGELSPKRLKALLEYVDHGFRLDPKSPVPWKEQFCSALSKACSDLLSAPVRLTADQVAQLPALVRAANLSVPKALGVPDPAKAFDMAVSYDYHDGFRHMTRDDDFIAVRRGGRIVGIIALPGNDWNDLINFLKDGGHKLVDPENLDQFRKAYSAARKAHTLDLLSRPVERRRRPFIPTLNDD